MVYIFDIDGTLSDLSHRLHFIETKPNDWDAFFAACGDDVPHEDVIQMARVLCNTGSRIILITGRSNQCERETRLWLEDHSVWYSQLLMRKQGDHRPDNIVKSELLDELLNTVPKDQIMGVFEDRDQVVNMYRDRGLRVYQVANGNF